MKARHSPLKVHIHVIVGCVLALVLLLLQASDVMTLPVAAAMGDTGQRIEGQVRPADDERVRVEATDEIPWRAIADLDVHFSGDIFGSFKTCTGFFVAPRIVVTSAHCIYDHQRNGYADEVKIMPGRNGRRQPLGSQTVSTDALYVPQRWIELRGGGDMHASEYDYGIITLPDETLGNQVGFWFNLAGTDELPGHLVNVSGYPSDKFDLACPLLREGCQLWTDAGYVSFKDELPRLAYYDAYTVKGQSGSPVWYVDDDGIYNVVAINTGAVYAVLSAGPRVTESMQQDIILRSQVQPTGPVSSPEQVIRTLFEAVKALDVDAALEAVAALLNDL